MNIALRKWALSPVRLDLEALCYLFIFVRNWGVFSQILYNLA